MEKYVRVSHWKGSFGAAILITTQVRQSTSRERGQLSKMSSKEREEAAMNAIAAAIESSQHCTVH